MASTASLTVAKFGTSTFTEVYSASVDYGGGASVSRSKTAPFSAQRGTVRLELFGAVSTSLWGTYDTITLTGNGMNLTFTALCTSVSFASNVNDAARATVQFQII